MNNAAAAGGGGGGGDQRYLMAGPSPLPCLNPAAPLSNADVVTTWDSHGTTAIYSCPPGWYFSQGGMTRTLTCTNATWPVLVPTCTGSLDTNIHSYNKSYSAQPQSYNY